jgi:hypothetical protein
MSLKWINVPSLLLLVLISTMFSGVGASGQSELAGASGKSEPEAKADSAPLPSTETLPKSYPVITAKRACPKSAAKKTTAKTECKVTLSRQDFEALVNGLNPGMVKGERRVLASTYGKALALAQEASRGGLDRDPRLRAQLEYSRLILLANAMSKEIYKDSLKSTDGDAEKYYASHKSLFERFTFDRIFIPLEKRAASPSKSGGVEVDSQPGSDLQQKEMKELAEHVYARAVAGESFEKLQIEVFKTAEIATEPNIKVEDLRRGDLSQVQNVIFNLEPGKISTLLTDDTGYFIYKMVSRIVPPFAEVKTQVTVRMQGDNSAEAVRKIEKLSNAQVNDAYFDKYDPPPPSKDEVDMDND